MHGLYLFDVHVPWWALAIVSAMLLRRLGGVWRGTGQP